MKEFFCEIGVEEIPAEYFPGLIEHVKQKTNEILVKSNLEFSDINVFATPQRLVIHVNRIAESQPTITKEIVGPPKKVAFDSQGNPTKSAEGFVNSKRATIQDLKIKNTGKGDFVYLVIEEQGTLTPDLLPRLMDELIRSLYFPKTMRWTDFDLKFVRPILWILLVYDGKPLPWKFLNLENQGVTYGHKLLDSRPLKVLNFDHYLEELKNAHVEINHVSREKTIRSEINQLLDKNKEILNEDEKLMTENVFLVEYPKVFRGEFNARFLELPQPILVSAIRKHQKAFTITDKSNKLQPSFIVVSNMPIDNMEEIRRGYERVLESRLADALFFFKEDVKLKLSERNHQLAQIVYHQDLGSLADKVNRLRKICGFLCEALKIDNSLVFDIERAAQLSKSDLVTEMVQEFPELQGIMGKEYAILNGEKQSVGNIIAEQYLPRFPGDKLPQTLGGSILSIADRMDTIVGAFCIGMKPSGTKDPYALRRNGRSMVEIICKWKLSFPVSIIVNKTVNHFQKRFKKISDSIINETVDFLKERLERYMLDNNIRYDIVNAVMAIDNDDLYDLSIRMETMESFRKSPEFEPLAIAFKRAGRILTEEATLQVNGNLLIESSEKELYDVFRRLEQETIKLLNKKQYLKVLKKMSEIRPVLDKFFDDVLVMHKDEKLRINRLSLMKSLTRFFCQMADFTQIVVEKSLTP